MSPRTAVSAESSDREADFVQSLQRGLAVIRAFDGESRTLTLGEVATATGLARAAAQEVPAHARRPGLRPCGRAALRAEPARARARARVPLEPPSCPRSPIPHLEALVDDVGESATIAVLDETDIVYVAHVPARRIMSITIGVGTRDPAFATSLGRVLLAAQERRVAGRVPRLGAALADHRSHRGGRRARYAQSSRGFAARDTRSSTRSSRRGFARSPCRSATQKARSSRRQPRRPRRTLDGRRDPRATSCLASGRRRARSRRHSRPPSRPCRRAWNRGRRPNGDVVRDADFVQSLERGLSVIRAFDGAPTALTLSDVAKATGLPRAAARRFLLTLVELGYMDVDGRRFRLRPKVLDLGRPYLSRLTLPDLALPHLRAFVKDVQRVVDRRRAGRVRDRLRRARLGAADPLRLRRRRDARPRVRHRAGPRAPRGPARRMAHGARALVPASALHRADDHEAARPSGTSSRVSGSRATRSSTRSSRTDYARSRSRSATATTG